MNEPVQAQEVTADIDKVVARIQKLLSRTKDGSGTTEAEADTALKMAQELAMRHNLDMAAIEASASSSNANAPVERVKDELKGRAMYKWQRQLAKYVAEANFCYHLVHQRSEWQADRYVPDKHLVAARGKSVDEFPKSLTQSEYWELPWEEQQFFNLISGRYKTTNKHIFVGRKSNVITAQLMFQYLTQTIEDLVVKEMDLTNAERLSRSAMSWKEGAGDRLCERLAARRKDLIAKHDARVQAEEADRKAAVEKARQEAANKPKGLPANHETEVKAAYASAADQAFDLTDQDQGPSEPDRPEVEDEEPWTPEGEEALVPETGTALVLASVYDENERDANYELAHNLEPGSLAKWKREREEAQRKAAEEVAEEVIEDVEQPVKQETERQRKARIAREEREYQANRRRWAREDAAQARREAREYAKRDHRAYRAGAEKGKDIGLDLQVNAGKEAKKLGD